MTDNNYYETRVRARDGPCTARARSSNYREGIIRAVGFDVADRILGPFYKVLKLSRHNKAEI